MKLQYNILFTLKDGTTRKVSTCIEMSSHVVPLKTVCDFEAIPIQDIVNITTESKLDIINC